MMLAARINMMRYFPFKILSLCVLLPPLIYAYSIQFLEKNIRSRYERELAATYIGDTRYLFDGSIRLQDAIKKNVHRFLSSRKLTRWGLHVAVTIRTRDGAYLFPDGYDGPQSDLVPEDNLTIARDNYRLLTMGLVRDIDVNIEHNTVLSNLLLIGSVVLAMALLFPFYRRGTRKIRAEERAKQDLIDNLANEHRIHIDQLQGLEIQRVELAERIAAMKKELEEERRKASATEDEMVEELITLEEKVSRNLEQQDQQQQELDTLKEQIRQFEKEKKSQNRQLLKVADGNRKRFNTLYKKIIIHDRAVDGFTELTEEMKIKAEEVIHQLNDDPMLVPVKRKVFGKKNRETVFEVIFAYKGRLYYRTITGNRVEILIVGTKLTQNKDLAFLDKL